LAGSSRTIALRHRLAGARLADDSHGFALRDPQIGGDGYGAAPALDDGGDREAANVEQRLGGGRRG
jgi:hypothetical protein